MYALNGICGMKCVIQYTNIIDFIVDERLYKLNWFYIQNNSIHLFKYYSFTNVVHLTTLHVKYHIMKLLEKRKQKVS